MNLSDATTGGTGVQPRRFLPTLPNEIPRHWLPGDPVVSSILNAYTVLVPANEAFYIRTLRACMPRIDDAALRSLVVDFVHQEAQHGIAHKRYWRNLDEQGYRFRGFERTVDLLAFRLVEKTTPVALRVSMVSCVEHINAYLGHEFLRQRLLAEAHPQMRALMEWHFAEEIEHKRVAFEVLQAVAPSYALRLLGFALTASLFYLLIGFGTLKFLARDGLLFRRSTWGLVRRHLWGGHHMARRTLGHLRDYLRPGFHPSQLDDAELAVEVIERYEGAEPPALEPTPRAQRARGLDGLQA